MSSLSDLISEARELRHYARNQGMSDAEIDECIEHVLSGYSSIHSRECEQRKCKLVFTILLTVVLISLPLYVVVACHKPTQTFFSRNIQDFIYPFMRYLRLSTLALHNRFPSITSKL